MNINHNEPDYSTVDQRNKGGESKMSELKGFRCDECETETEDLTQWTTIHYFKLMPDIFGGEYYTPQINHYCSSVCLAKNIDKYQAIQDTTDKEKK